jgi:type VI protein secretion system component Hcp
MANSVAEAYLLILRPTLIPVVGEAVPIPFNEQIELDEWHWDLKHEEKGPGGKKGGKAAPSPSPAKKEPLLKPDELIRNVTDLQKKSGVSQEERDKRVRELIKKTAENANDKAEKDDGDDDKADGENKLTFTFSKNVDLATTQLLNSMKAGDVMKRAIVTLFHRSTNVPVTLVVTFGDVTLTDYKLKLETTETMSDMKEEWTANFKTVDYVYQNRPAASGPNGLTKGTARVFKMNLKNLF